MQIPYLKRRNIESSQPIYIDQCYDNDRCGNVKILLNLLVRIIFQADYTFI